MRGKIDNMSKYAVTIFLLIISSCRNQNEFKGTNGFIIYNNFNQFYFVPTKVGLDRTDCLASLRSENLGKGILFHTDDNEYLSLFQKFAIELKDQLVDSTYLKDLQTIKIVPVSIDYQEGDILDKLGDSFVFAVNQKNIMFKFEYRELAINHLKVVDCEINYDLKY